MVGRKCTALADLNRSFCTEKKQVAKRQSVAVYTTLGEMVRSVGQTQQVSRRCFFGNERIC